MPRKCVNGHEMTPENTYTYRGDSQCRTCRRAAVTRSVRKAGKAHPTTHPQGLGARPRKFDHDLALLMYEDGVTVAELARFFGVSGPSVHRIVNPAYRARQVEGNRLRRAARA